MSNAIELIGVTKRFGSVTVVAGVNLAVRHGAVHAVIGPNGAGKTTLFALISGVQRPDAGRITLTGRNVTRMAEHRRARLGLARTFQRSQVFGSQTCLENVLVAVARRAGVGARWLRPATAHRDLVRCSTELLASVGLADQASRPAGSLAHGRRRQLELAIALGSRPRVLLLDEPAAGTSADETERLITIIRSLPDDITVLIIEHDLDLVFALADSITVLHLGRELATGTPAEIRASASVREAYLGAPGRSRSC